MLSFFLFHIFQVWGTSLPRSTSPVRIWSCGAEMVYIEYLCDNKSLICNLLCVDMKHFFPLFLTWIWICRHFCRSIWVIIGEWGSSLRYSGQPPTSAWWHHLHLPRSLPRIRSHLGNSLLSWLWRERSLLHRPLTPLSGGSLVRAAR